MMNSHFVVADLRRKDPLGLTLGATDLSMPEGKTLERVKDADRERLDQAFKDAQLAVRLASGSTGAG